MRLPSQTLVVLLALLFAAGCKRAPVPTETEQVLAWQPVGTWSGSADIQTESFTSQTGTFKFTWETKDTTPTPGHTVIMLHSAVSGRPLVEAVDHTGAGKDAIFVSEDPREFYVVVTADRSEWSLKVEEGISLILTKPAKRQ
jgi:hypothetical protein